MPPKPRKNNRATRADYASITFRPTPLLDRRLRALSAATGQSVGALIKDCVSAHIGTLEKVGQEVAP